MKGLIAIAVLGAGTVKPRCGCCPAFRIVVGPVGSLASFDGPALTDAAVFFDPGSSGRLIATRSSQNSPSRAPATR
jgi:hypothetical protein